MAHRRNAKNAKSTANTKSAKKIKTSKKAKQIAIEPSLIQCRKEIPIENLVLDPENYRIKYLKLKKQSDIQEHLLLHEDGRTMIKKILSAGQTYEESYVIPIRGGKYLVLEGNTRCAAQKEINDLIASGNLIPQSKCDFKKIKCIVLKPKLSMAKIRRLLAELHLAGKRQWKSTSKGAMIWDMINEDAETFQSIGDLLGSSRKNIEDLYKAYKLTIKFGKKYPTLNFTHFFSYWHEFYKKKTLQIQTANDPGFIDWVMQLVADKLITEHKQMRILGTFYDKGSTQEALKKTLEILNSGNHISVANDTFVNMTTKLPSHLVLKVNTILGAIGATSLQNCTAQQFKECLKELDITITWCNYLKTLRGGLGAAGAIIVKPGDVTP
jgi:hypothetical protein